MENKLILRKNVKTEDTWNLSLLYKNDSEFESDFKKMEEFSNKAKKFKGNLSNSASELKNILDSIMKASIILEKLGSYAFLKQTEDLTNNDSNIKAARLSKLSSEISANLSFFGPELMSIEDKKIKSFLKDEVLKEYLIYLNNILKYKPHTLSEKEERILALQGELSSTASNVFDTLNDADLDFGEIKINNKKMPLTHATFSSFQQSQDRKIRKESYNQFYKEYDKHKNTLAELYASQIKQDIFSAKIRNYKSVREMELFQDDIPVSVYDSLIESVHNALPSLHNYYKYCQKKLRIKDFRQYDKYAPIVKNVKIKNTFNDAVNILSKAFEPLGEEYTNILTKGLNSRWVDKYENKGKTSIGVQLACRFGGEIISADSRQTYRGLDLGSGKDLDEYTVCGKKIPYHLIDIADLSVEYNVFHYQQDFYRVFDELVSRKVLPIVVGGTGMYLDAVIRNYDLVDVPEIPEIRKKLESKTLEELGKIYLELKPDLHTKNDLLERERIIRGIEIYYGTHGELAEKLKKSMYRRPEINPLVIGTTLEREKIRENIKKRLQERIDAGMIEEVDGLHARGFSWERLEKLGLEYRFCALFLQGKISREELFEQLFIAIRQFAKRQETWFRFMEKNGVKINWLPSVPDKETRINAAVELVQKEMGLA